MMQLNEGAVVTYSTTVRHIGIRDEKLNKRSTKNTETKGRIWIFLFQFKAKHRVRLQRSSDLKKRSPNYEELDTFHRACKSIIFLGQLFGMLPVSNILAENPKEVFFNLKAYPILFTMMFLVFGGLIVLSFTKKTLEAGVTPRNIVAFVFFYSNITTCIRFIFLAKNWPNLLRHWTHVELLFLMPPYKPVSNFTLRWKLKVLASTFAVIAFLEHALYFASTYYNFHMIGIHCRPNETEKANLVSFVENRFHGLFSDVSFNVFYAAYYFFLNATFSFIWNYLDVFIMLVSVSIALRFQQLAQRIRSLQGHFVSEDLWYEIRHHHIQLCELMADIDENLSGLVLTSCAINMYFICNQLLNIFTKLRWAINYFYFWFSLLYLIGRTACIFLCAAKVHDAALLPLRTLYLVPSTDWSTEVQRFYAQIRDEPIAFTGKRFFQVTKRNFFGFMATIITYEFMLLQFDAKNWKKGLPPLCQ